MSRAGLERLVGFVACVVVIASSYAIVRVGRLSPFEPKQTVWVLFQDAQYLARGNNVRSEGLNIGQVESLELREDGILVKLTVDPLVAIRERKNRISVRSLTTLGGQYVDIETGDPTSARLSSSERKPIRGLPGPELTKEISATFEGATPHIVSAVANIGEAMRRIDEAQGTLGKLINEDGLQQDFRRATQRFEVTTRQIRGMSEKINEAQGTLGKLFFDPRFQDLVGGLRERVTSIGDKVSGGGGVAGAIVTDDSISENAAIARERLGEVMHALTSEDGIVNGGGRMDRIRELMAKVSDDVGAIAEAFRDARGPIAVVTQDEDAGSDFERASDNLAALSRMPETGSVGRLFGDDHLRQEMIRIFYDRGSSADDTTDLPPVANGLQGIIRGYIEPAPRGGLRASQSE